MRRLLIGLLATFLAGPCFAQQIVTGGGAASILIAPTAIGTSLTSAQIGTNVSATGGVVGIGTTATPGVGLQVNLPIANGQANEQWAIGGVVTNNPSAAVAAQTNWFGTVINCLWGGSANSGSNGLCEGAQFYGYHATGSTSSLGTIIGTESAAIDLATSGTVGTESGSTNSVSVTGGATVSNAYGGTFQVTCSTPANCTAGAGIHVLNTASGNAKGILIDDQTQASAYAIYSGQGQVFHNDIFQDGDGTTRPAEIIVNGKTGQTQNLLDLKVNGSSVLTVSNGGSLTPTQDTNFGATNAIFGAAQGVRLNSTNLNQASANVIAWSLDTHAYDTLDTSISRSAAGVVAIGTGAQGSVAGALKATAYIAAGSPPTLSGTCTTGSQTGGNTAGTFTATCTSQTVIITFAITAPTGWNCNLHDRTTVADALNQTASSTTSCTSTGTTAASDVIGFDATPY